MPDTDFTSPNYYVNALLDGDSWTGNVGQAATVTYDFGYTVENGTLLSNYVQGVAKQAMQQWADVANVHWAAVGGTSDVTVTQKNLDSIDAEGVTYSDITGTNINHAEVIIDSGDTSFPTGSYAYTAFIHEFGHSLGLKHPEDYGDGTQGPYLPLNEATFNATLMSYDVGDSTKTGVYPSTPMLYDIAAMQYLYGANTSYNGGDTGYHFDSTKLMETIWDGGGNDTVFAPDTASTIDLREGLPFVSHIGGAELWMAYGAHMENAVGGAGNDTVDGNQYDNQLYGGHGNDYVNGDVGNDLVVGGQSGVDPTDGNDTLLGGLGNDTIYGNGGNDLIYGGQGIADTADGNDLIYGGSGFDTIYGNAGNDTLYGGGSGYDPTDGADLIYGGKGADVIFGNGGNDTLYGGGSNYDPTDSGDLIYGGDGDDLIFGNGGDDTLVGGAGNNTLNGGAGNDTYVIGAGESDVITQFEGANAPGGDILQLQRNVNGGGIVDYNSLIAHAHAEGGNLVIDLGAGHSLTIDGVASLGAGDVTFYG